MPQMSPMWWTLLMIMVILSFIFIMAITFFNLNPSVSGSSKPTFSKMIWKW